MECDEIKKIIPQYFQHTASEEEIQAVEEHLCVCHDCRTLLGELMDKASSGEEAVEAPSQEKPQEEVEEKKEEEIPAPSDKKQDKEYFPGENLEVSMDKVDEILGKAEPAKGESGEEPQELKPILEDKEEEKTDKEGSSFEVIKDIPSAPKQELPAENDIETLGKKEPEPVKEEIKEPEEKLEVSPKEKKDKPEIHWESGLELEEKKLEEPVKEIKEPQAEPKREEEQLKQSPEDSEGEVPKSEVPEGDESEGKKESGEEASYTLDESFLEKGKIGLIECFCLLGGLAVLGFLAYLFLKG